MITESSLTGDEDTSLVIVEHQQGFECPHLEAETSAQKNKTESEATDEFGISCCSLEEECIIKKKLAEENKRKETVPMEWPSCLPIVTDCANTLFSAVSGSTDYTEVGEDAISYVESETAPELQTSAAAVNEGDKVIPEAAIDKLSQEFKPIYTTPQESAEDNRSHVEEKLITRAVFAPLSGEQGTRPTGPEEPVSRRTIMPFKDKTFAEEVNEEVLEALLKDFELVPESIVEDITEVSTSEQPVEESVRQPETTILAAIPETTEDEDTEERVEAVLKVIAEEITPAGCNLATCKEAAPEIITKVDPEKKAKNESTTDSTLDSQSADTDALLVKLQSACKSVVEASTYRLGGLEISSLRHSITIAIHVAPKAKEQ